MYVISMFVALQKSMFTDWSVDITKKMWIIVSKYIKPAYVYL